MDNLIYSNDQNLIKICISKDIVNELCEICVSSLPNEIGGILIGHYVENNTCAKITEVLKAPKDSKGGSTWFYRGTFGIKKKLDKLWEEKGLYYIGEWHYHPNSSSNLSNQDISQMTSISYNSSYKCPEPILLIIGGNSKSWEYSTYIFPKGENFVRFNNTTS
ncbi:Mov34/MPN/PAD-1 family protein [Bacillus sp. ISL-39]|uniref:Mov34/MPN/PAD-1 family protein n=1 Tax=Bacillus sp. ISL-39 TaxID=2819124 RepID=UPI001BECB446|nr:Mov34/MPN/PAD-1 family protein [Bacillus sp. ISL-39]MBT2639368.1 Mov34/MPN/PAD-1 family protein [Bacillus sp. ISL-39]